MNRFRGVAALEPSPGPPTLALAIFDLVGIVAYARRRGRVAS